MESISGVNCTCLKPVFNDMILLRVMGAETRKGRKEVRRPMLAYNMIINVPH
jgi:hypothetical protein